MKYFKNRIRLKAMRTFIGLIKYFVDTSWHSLLHDIHSSPVISFFLTTFTNKDMIAIVRLQSQKINRFNRNMAKYF